MAKERPTVGTDGKALPILPPERDPRVWIRLVRVMFYTPGFLALLLFASVGLAAQGGVAGVTWAAPALWKEQAPRPMRAATYTVPAAPGDAEGGECGVYFFGKGQGGDAEANIARWTSQFEGGSPPARTTKSVSGMTIQIVQISGTYLAPSGPMMQSQGKKPGYSLVGAIVPAPEGSVFFKLTGPSKTVAAARAAFDALIGSIKK